MVTAIKVLKSLMGHTSARQQTLKPNLAKPFLDHDTTPSKPFFSNQHSLNKLKPLIRHFLSLNQELYKTYFVKRSMFNPIDEIAFEQDWKNFIAAGSELYAKLDFYKKHLESEPYLFEGFSILCKQFTAFQDWFNKLQRMTQFNHIAKHLEDLLAHEPVINSHTQICCSDDLISNLLLQPSTTKLKK